MSDDKETAQPGETVIVWDDHNTYRRARLARVEPATSDDPAASAPVVEPAPAEPKAPSVPKRAKSD